MRLSRKFYPSVISEIHFFPLLFGKFGIHILSALLIVLVYHSDSASAMVYPFRTLQHNDLKTEILEFIKFPLLVLIYLGLTFLLNYS